MLMRVLMRMRMKCRSQSITATSWWYGIFLFFTAKLFALRDGRIRFHIYFTPLFIREKVYQLRGAAPSHSTTQQQGSKQASKQASSLGSPLFLCGASQSLSHVTASASASRTRSARRRAAVTDCASVAAYDVELGNSSAVSLSQSLCPQGTTHCSHRRSNLHCSHH